MRLIHTSDRHLGRILHGVHLTEDQAHVLDQFVTLVQDSQVDAVLIAGDVYDRAVPPPEAVALLDETLARLVRGLQVPVLMIAGNHDSPPRLAFASRLLEGQGLHVVGAVPSTPRCIVMRDQHGPVYVYMVTLLDPAPILAAMGKLRTVYPNVLHLIRPQFTSPDDGYSQRGDHRRLSD